MVICYLPVFFQIAMCIIQPSSGSSHQDPTGIEGYLFDLLKPIFITNNSLSELLYNSRKFCFHQAFYKKYKIKTNNFYF